MTISELNDMAEGRVLLTTKAVRGLCTADYMHLRSYICSHNCAGAYFLNQVLDRIERWGFKTAKHLYSTRTIEPVVVFDTNIYIVLLLLCHCGLGVCTAFNHVAWVNALTLIMQYACLIGYGWLLYRGGDRMQEILRTPEYGKVQIRQSEIFIPKTKEHIFYSQVHGVTIENCNLTLVMKSGAKYSISIKLADIPLANYVKARCNIDG